MMVAHAVLFKIALVWAGGDDGHILGLDNAEILAARPLRLLQPGAPRPAARRIAHKVEVAAEVDYRAAHAVRRKLRFQRARDVALRYRAEVEPHA